MKTHFALSRLKIKLFKENLQYVFRKISGGNRHSYFKQTHCDMVKFWDGARHDYVFRGNFDGSSLKYMMVDVELRTDVWDDLAKGMSGRRIRSPKDVLTLKTELQIETAVEFTLKIYGKKQTVPVNPGLGPVFREIHGYPDLGQLLYCHARLLLSAACLSFHLWRS